MTGVLNQIRPAIVMVIGLSLILGLAYPLAITGIAQVAFPGRADGSLVTDSDGNIIGAKLIAQNFTEPHYFWPRPSAAGADGYDAASSGGSNLGPTSQQLRDTAIERADALRLANQLPDNASVPAEAVTTSASGLDPDISPENAYFQALRVAQARGVSEDVMLEFIDDHTEGRTLGVLGQERINVLEINMALDEEFPLE
jgi:K+-transporting ATPase ATPase C chain